MTDDSLPPVEFSRRDCRVIDNVLEHAGEKRAEKDGEDWQRLRTRVSDVNTKLAEKTDHRHRDDTRRKIRNHDLTTYDLRQIRHAIDVADREEITALAEEEDAADALRLFRSLRSHLSNQIGAANGTGLR